MPLIGLIGHVSASSVMLAIILTACAPTTAIVATDPVIEKARAVRVACDAFEPIGWSSRDTDTTILGIKAHNAAYAALCRQ